MNIGDNIARIRKAKGITQERLGELMGVTAQAVSKWENGGAPDVALLPMLAENLGVSVDSLFGLEDRPAGTMAQTLRTWLLSMPADRRIPEMYRAMAGSFYTLIQDMGAAVDSKESLPTKTAYDTVGGDEVFYRAYIDAGCGQALGILGEDFPMYLLMPRPEGGYARNLASLEDYRRLFACLAKPGVLEVLCCLHSSILSISWTSSLQGCNALAQLSIAQLTPCWTAATAHGWPKPPMVRSAGRASVLRASPSVPNPMPLRWPHGMPTMRMTICSACSRHISCRSLHQPTNSPWPKQAPYPSLNTLLNRTVQRHCSQRMSAIMYPDGSHHSASSASTPIRTPVCWMATPMAGTSFTR